MTKSILNYLTAACLVLFLASCEKDDNSVNSSDFIAAFEQQSISLSREVSKKEVQVVFSEAAPQNGSIKIGFDLTNMTYGEDFKTTPPANSGIIEIPIKAGAKKVSFTFHKLVPNPTEGEPEKKVKFTIAEVGVANGATQGNTHVLITYSESASLGGNMAPKVGGPNEPNQVYVDLSGENQTVVRRDQWDLAFYSGDKFRVKLNSSLFMMAAELKTTDIDAVTAADVEALQPKMKFLTKGANNFVDHPSGDLNKTVIAEISATAGENKVYLLKLGYEIGTNNSDPGDVAIEGPLRGWKKVRIIRKDGGYLLQYADLNSTTHKEIMISKSSTTNFTFFSIETESTVEVAPKNSDWDMSFTTYTEILDLPSGGKTAYGFSDYVITNRHSGTKAYSISTKDIAYEEFSLNDVKESKFELDQRVIGSNWRSVTPPKRYLIDDIFYVIKDSKGNTYKLKFTALMNKNGVRGYPEFQYDLLK